MKKRKFKRNIAALCAVSMLAGTVAVPDAINTVRAGQILDETSFDYKAIPWRVVESKPAKQDFEITDDGTFHIKVLKAEGADKEKCDLQVRYRNLDFYAGYTYEISFKVKAKREGMELCSRIINYKGDEEYCVLDVDKMHNGPHMDGECGKAMKLTTDWTEVTGIFIPTKDLEACQWAFEYAKGTQYEGNAEDGDELWFDDMSIWDATGTEYGYPGEHFGIISRVFSGLDNNFISVNQVGYFPNSEKIAVFSDNAGEIHDIDSWYGEVTINIPKPVKFEVVDAKSETVVYSGYSTEPVKDADSGDTVCKLDFSGLCLSGKYYIRIKNDKNAEKYYRSYEFEIGNDIYTEKDYDLFTNAMNYFFQNRSAIDIEKKYITSGDKSRLAHKGGHKTDTALVQKIWKNEYCEKNEAEKTASSEITANGGWYEAETHSKNMVNGGMAVWTLQNLYEMQNLHGSSMLDDNSGKVIIPENGNKIPDILDEAAYELEWMSQMKISTDDEKWGEKAAGLYSHRICDSKWTGLAIKPWDYMKEWKTERIAKPPTFAATLSYAACAAQAARLWNPYDQAKSEYYLSSAVDAYKAYKKAYYEADLSETYHPEYGTVCVKEELREDSLYAPVYHNKTGRNYGDYDVSDEAYLAACEIFVSAKKMNKDYADDYLEELERFNMAYTVSPYLNYNNDYNRSLTSFNCNNRVSAGSFTLALHKDLLAPAKADILEETITETAEVFRNEEVRQGYGIPYTYNGMPYNSPEYLEPDVLIKGYERDSNRAVLNNAIVMAYAYELTGDVNYINGVTQAMDYLLGTNPFSFSYVSGYGSYRLCSPHHRYWSMELDRELPSVPGGVVSGGPNAGLEDIYVRLLGYIPGKESNPSQRCYVDSAEAWSVNTPSLELNASLAWVTGYLQGIYAPFPVSEPTASPEPIMSPEPTEIIISEDTRGDIDCDGKIDITDLSALAIALVDREELKGQANKNADIDKDGEVTLVDLATLRQYLSKKITEL